MGDAATEERPFKCPQCGKKFPSNDAVEQHRDDMGHNEKYMCSTCKRIFTTEVGLRDHQAAKTHAETAMDDKNNPLQVLITESKSQEIIKPTPSPNNEINP